MNERMHWVLGHLCVNIDSTGPGEPFEDSEINKIALPLRHRIRGRARYHSVTEAPRNTAYLRVDMEEIFLIL